MDGLTTTDAASRLKVSRQHLAALLKDGRIAGEQLRDGRWIVSPQSLNEYRVVNGGRGRSWSADTSWALLAELDGRESDHLSLSTRQRIRTRLRDSDASTIARKVAGRTTAHRFSADNLSATASNLLLTGRSAAAEAATDLADQKRIVEGYLRTDEESVATFARRHLLVTDTSGDVIIYDRPRSAVAGDFLGRAVIAADLARSTSTRERSAGINLLEELRQAWLSKHTQ